jgi:hypothetical protein
MADPCACIYERLQSRLLFLPPPDTPAKSTRPILNPGDTVTLTFALGKSANFTLVAITRHRRGFHYGFEYQNAPAATLQSLKDSLISIGYSADLEPLV